MHPLVLPGSKMVTLDHFSVLMDDDTAKVLNRDHPRFYVVCTLDVLFTAELKG
jgi:hypothetical protein